jgi:nucleoside-diphosphate-sugar epimerase
MRVQEYPLLAFDVNVGGTINLLNVLSGIERQRKLWFFYAGTSHVYKSAREPIKETSALQPVSLYGRTKLMGEEIALTAGQTPKYKLDVCAGRIFSFYHKTQPPSFLYSSLVKRLKKEDLAKPFFLPGADSLRDFLTAEEVCDIIIALAKRRAAGVFNIASGKSVKIRDFTQSLTEKPLKIITAGKADYMVADITKLKKVLDK